MNNVPSFIMFHQDGPTAIRQELRSIWGRLKSCETCRCSDVSVEMNYHLALEHILLERWTNGCMTWMDEKWVRSMLYHPRTCNGPHMNRFIVKEHFSQNVDPRPREIYDIHNELWYHIGVLEQTCSSQYRKVISDYDSKRQEVASVLYDRLQAVIYRLSITSVVIWYQLLWNDVRKCYKGRTWKQFKTYNETTMCYKVTC